MSASDIIADNLVQTDPQGNNGGAEGKKKRMGGNIATLRFTNPSSNPPLTLMAEVRHKEIEVQPLLDLESGIQRVGPNGQPIVSKREDHYYELNKEIVREEIKYIQMIDGKQETVAKLSMTNTIDILEGRPFDECTLLDESENVHKTLGTTIPREEVYRYAPEAIHAAWPKDDSQAWAVYQLAEYLEKQRVALFFPYTHGMERMPWCARRSRDPGSHSSTGLKQHSVPRKRVQDLLNDCASDQVRQPALLGLVKQPRRDDLQPSA